MWETGFVLSLCAVALFVLVAALFRNKLKPFYVLFAGVLVTATIAFYPACYLLVSEGAGRGATAVLYAFVNAMRIFAIGSEDELLVGITCEEAGDFWVVYRVLLVALMVIAPFFTFGFAVSLFKNFSAQLRLSLLWNRDAYVFSQLNERSLLLATDIRKNHPKAAIAFGSVSAESSQELAERAEKLGAILFSKGVVEIGFKLYSPKRQLRFFAIAEDPAENLERTVELVETYKTRDNTHVYLFSGETESEMLLSAMDKGKVKVRRINEVRSLVNRLLYEQGNVLFDSAKAGVDGNKHICAVVVGMGRYGTEVVKALTWFGQMDGYVLDIHVFDKDPQAEARFMALAPELMRKEFNGTNIPGEAQYSITVNGGVDVKSAEFVRRIQALEDATYVVVALGADSANIDTAVDLRTYFAQVDCTPVINAIVHNSHQKTVLTGIKNYRGQSYDITFIGDLETACSEAVLLNSELEEDALRRHLKWGKEEEFWTYEYNYRSSVASAIHMKARIHCGIPGANKKEGELTVEERDIIEVLEHRRWNAYMRTEGYVYSGSRDKASRNDLAKRHHDLVPFAALSEEDKRKDSKVGTN
ncbi:MAG: hypothetical protein IKU07_01410 [Oscillospiraceae bacterium]|nr:hypothetical protein [Oscillospiraceae bacterium]